MLDRIELCSGDMLDPALGTFDHVVPMDSLIHYDMPDAVRVLDRPIQIHGAAAVSRDFPLASMWAAQRTLRLADGPDEVHRRVIGGVELKKYEGADRSNLRIR